MAHDFLNGSRRRDVFTPRTVKIHHRAGVRRRAVDYSAAELLRGVDAAGRFIGPGDIDRACRHFWAGREHLPHVRGFIVGAGT